MPDWFTHTLIGWIAGKVIKIEVGLVVLGSLIPDIIKIDLVFQWFDLDLYNVLAPIHTPAGAFLIGGMLALFFEDIKKAFIPLGVGITTHFILDLFLFPISGGMKLLFPFSWEGWQYGIISSIDYRITIIAVFTSILVYMIYLYHDQKLEKNTEL